MPVTQSIGGEPQGNWTAMNDVEVADDGIMYWAIFEYVKDGDGFKVIRLTGYDLTNKEAWNVVYSHNAMGWRVQ